MLKKFTENELQQKYTDKRMNIINVLKDAQNISR